MWLLSAFRVLNVPIEVENWHGCPDFWDWISASDKGNQAKPANPSAKVTRFRAQLIQPGNCSSHICTYLIYILILFRSSLEIVHLIYSYFLDPARKLFISYSYFLDPTKKLFISYTHSFKIQPGNCSSHTLTF